MRASSASRAPCPYGRCEPVVKRGIGGGGGAAVRRLNLSLDIGVQFGTQVLEERARDAQGRFTSAQNAARLQNERMAEELANYMVKALDEAVAQRGRPQRGTELLARAILDPENRDANIDGFVVGTDYLDRSPAKSYWRGVEEGSAVHVGRLIYGWFADSVPSSPGERFAPMEGRVDRRLIQVSRENYPQHFGPVGKGGAAHSAGPFFFRIKNPIPAYQFMEKGRKEWLATDALERSYRKVFEDVGLTVEFD
jgi:hypothetical protein